MAPRPVSNFTFASSAVPWDFGTSTEGWYVGSPTVGITLKTVSVKWDPETTRMSDELQAHFSPLVEGRSQLTRLAIKKLHSDVIANGTVAALASCLQGLSGITLSPQPVIEFPAHPQVAKRDLEFESLLANATLQPAKVPNSIFPRMAFKTGVVQ